MPGGSAASDSVPVVPDQDAATGPPAPRAALAARLDASWPVLARVAAIGMTFVFSLVVGRALGTGSAGLVFTAVVVVTLLSTAGRLGVDLDAMKRASRLHDVGGLTQESLGWARLVRLCVLGAVPLTVVAMVVIALAGDRVADARAYLVFALAVPLQALAVLAAAVLRGGGRHGVGALVEVGLAQGLAALGVVVLAVGGRASAGSVAVVFVVAQGAVCALALWLVRSVWGTGPALPDPPAPASRSQLLSMMGSGLLFYVLTWSPLLVLAVMGSAHDTSLYGAAARFPTAVAIIPTVLVTAVLPGLIASFAHDRAEDGNYSLARINRLAAIGAAAVSLPLLVAAPWVMGLFGPGFEEGAGTLRLLAIGQLIAVLLGPTALLPPVLGLEKQAQWLLLGGCVLSFGLGAVLVGPFGAEGAATGWLVALTGYGVVMAWMLRRSAGVVSPLRLR